MRLSAVFPNNMRGLALIPLLLIFSAPLFPRPVPAQETARARSIAALNIKGSGEVDIGEIRNVIAEIVPPGKLLFWRPLPPFDEPAVERNVEYLRQFLALSGYYQSSVAWSAEDEGERTVAVNINIYLGRPVVVTGVAIEAGGELAPERLSEVTEALREVPLARGGRFSARRFKKAKGVVRNALLEMGYARASLDSRAEVDRVEGRAFVKFTVSPGKRYAFGDIDIRLEEGALRRLVAGGLSYKTGEPSSPSKLVDSRRRITGLGYFDSVSITTEIDDEAGLIHTAVRPVRSKTMTLQLGAGAGRLDLLRGRVKLINRSFLSLNRTLELSARASFASLGAAAVVRQPGVFGPGSAAALLFDVRRDDFPSYEADFLIGSAEFAKTFADGLVSARFNPTVLGSEIKSRSVDRTVTRGLENVFLVTLGAGVELAATDNPVDPARGVSSHADFELSGAFLGSEEEYFKAVFETAGYVGLGRVVLAKKVQVGFIKPFGRTRRADVPPFARLFAGGGKSMRGFAFQELGPLDPDKNPLGGNSLLTGVVEARVPVWRKLGAVFFLDYGNVFAGGFDRDPDELRYAAGTGLRYKVAGIPVALDFGYALNPNPRLGRYQFFVDVGQAF